MAFDLQVSYASTTASWEASRSLEGDRRRQLAREVRHELFWSSGGAEARANNPDALTGPQQSGQACTGCSGRNHFSLLCVHVPRLCKVCCIYYGRQNGPCRYHKKQMEEVAAVVARRDAEAKGKGKGPGK
jgi:hypothetical protein